MEQEHDRRLDLVRNKVNVPICVHTRVRAHERTRAQVNMPIGVWAHWCVKTSVFNGAVLIMICISALMLGAQTELDPVAYWKVHTHSPPLRRRFRAPAHTSSLRSVRTHNTQTAFGR